MGRVRGELHGSNVPHEVPMVVAVAVVVAQDPAVVHMAAFQIDVGQILSNYFVVLKPDLFLEHRALALASERVDLRGYGFHRALFLAHKNSVTQTGFMVSRLRANSALTGAPAIEMPLPIRGGIFLKTPNAAMP